MSSIKRWIFIGVLGFFCGGLLVGCSDSPENEASKRLRENTEKALELANSTLDPKGDGPVDVFEMYGKAREELNKALRDARSAPGAANTAYMASGNLAFGQAQYLLMGIDERIKPMDDIVDKMSVSLGEISSFQVQVDVLNELYSAGQNEINDLEKTLKKKSAGGNPGLNEQLKTEEAKLKDLKDTKAQLLEKSSAAQGQADGIQAEADAKLRESEVSGEEEKAALQREALALLMDKKNYIVEAQEAEDEILIIESRILLGSTLVEKLKSDKAAVEKRIKFVKTSKQRSGLKSRAAEINKHIKDGHVEISQLKGLLSKAQEAYDKEIEQIISLFGEAAEDYKKVKRGAIKQTSDVHTADCFFQSGVVYRDKLKLGRFVGSRVGSLATVISGQSKKTLAGVADDYEKGEASVAQKAMENIDSAIEAYAKLGKGISSKPDNTEVSLLKSWILALYTKMDLAEITGDDSVADEAYTQADELMEKVKAADNSFGESVTAKLFEGSSDYIPFMEVDSGTLYEGIRDEMQSWRELKGDERKAKAAQWLEELARLEERTNDLQEFERILGPEVRALELALTGDDEEDDMEIADANGLF